MAGLLVHRAELLGHGLRAAADLIARQPQRDLAVGVFANLLPHPFRSVTFSLGRKGVRLGRDPLHKGIGRVFVYRFHQPLIHRFRLGVRSFNNDIGIRHGVNLPSIMRGAFADGIRGQFHLLDVPGAEQPLTVLGRKLDTGRRGPGIDEIRPRLAHRFWTHKGPVRRVELPLIGNRFPARPSPLHERDKLVRHFVAQIVVGKGLPEQGLLIFDPARHHIQPPTALGEIVDSRPEFGKVEGMKAVGHMGGGKKQNPARERSQRCRGCQEIERVFVKARFPAVPEPAAKRHLEFESYPLGKLDQILGRVPVPEVLIAVRVIEYRLGDSRPAGQIPTEQAQ